MKRSGVMGTKIQIMSEKIGGVFTHISSAAKSALPERRIEIHSEGGQRTLRIGTREQLMGIASTTMIAGWLAIGTVNMVATNPAAVKTEAELTRMAAQVQALKADTNALKGEVATTAERIEKRQEFLDALLSNRNPSNVNIAELLPSPSAKKSSSSAAEQGILAPFAALEQKQIALADRAAATAQTRLRDAEALIGRLGLKPGRFLASTSTVGRLASGGPYIPAGDQVGTDPRFTELYVNWQRVEQIEQAMASLPAFVPTSNYTLTSSYGVRSDPFHGRRARHAGLDMAGSHGDAIYAAAAGRVVRASWFGAYGNAIDIDHGHGIITRYAHLSKINVKVGQKVTIGQKIAAMGSTGRSTGPHLHYEVRIDGEPVDPRLFIESSTYLLSYHDKKIGPLPTVSEAYGR